MFKQQNKILNKSTDLIQTTFAENVIILLKTDKIVY